MSDFLARDSTKVPYVALPSLPKFSSRSLTRVPLVTCQDLMRMKSIRVAGKGLELACFVAERLGSWPDETGAFAFSWTPEDESDVGGAPDCSVMGEQVRTARCCLCACLFG